MAAQKSRRGVVKKLSIYKENARKRKEKEDTQAAESYTRKYTTL